MGIATWDSSFTFGDPTTWSGADWDGFGGDFRGVVLAGDSEIREVGVKFFCRAKEAKGAKEFLTVRPHGHLWAISISK